MIIYMSNHIVGAPTFWSAAAGRRFYAVSTAKKVIFFAASSGPPQKDGPYTRQRLLLRQRGAYSFAPFAAFPLITDN
jgi:hypothetical protein